MSGDPKADLIYAILSLDSYDQGYGSAINWSAVTGVPNSPGPSQIGAYSVVQDSSILLKNGVRLDEPAGFYAIAYKNAATGQTVIAYRGTDSVPGSPQSGGSDLTNGYGLALGQTNSAQITVPVY